MNIFERAGLRRKRLVVPALAVNGHLEWLPPRSRAEGKLAVALATPVLVGSEVPSVRDQFSHNFRVSR